MLIKKKIQKLKIVLYITKLENLKSFYKLRIERKKRKTKSVQNNKSTDILNKKYNSCGVSVFINEESLKLVIILAYNPIEIKKIKRNLLGRLIIEG